MQLVIRRMLITFGMTLSWKTNLRYHESRARIVVPFSASFFLLLGKLNNTVKHVTRTERVGLLELSAKQSLVQRKLGTRIFLKCLLPKCLCIK